MVTEGSSEARITNQKIGKLKTNLESHFMLLQSHEDYITNCSLLSLLLVLKKGIASEYFVNSMYSIGPSLHIITYGKSSLQLGITRLKVKPKMNKRFNAREAFIFMITKK